MSGHREPAIFIIDDDLAYCEALQRTLAAAGYRSVVHADAESFLLEKTGSHPECLVAETKLPGISGPALHQELKRRGCHFPIVFVTAHSTVAAAVSAMRDGAADYIEKPVEMATLLAVIENVLQRQAFQRCEDERKSMIAASLEKLTSREREIMHFVIAGKMNKTIAAELCISIKTVEAHRARMMRKVGVDSVAALVHLALQLPPSSHAH
jgi:FixJ family two-component response regulator